MTKEGLSGFTFRGRSHTQAARDKMSKAHLGIPHSKAHNDNIAEALRGKQMPTEVVEKLSTVWNIARPLVLRGGVAIEIEKVTDFSRLQIINVMNRKRPPRFSAYSTPQQKSEAQKKSHTLSWRERNGNFSQADKKISEIAKALVKEGYFTDDLRHRQGLQELYRQRNRLLPEDFALGLCCEAYFVSRVNILKNSNRDMLDKYVEIVKGFRKGNEPLCPEILTKEQMFILNAVNSKHS